MRDPGSAGNWGILIGSYCPAPAWRFIAPNYFTVPAGSTYIRMFNPADHGQQALTFRHNGPLRRFDHQKLVAGKAANCSDRGILYAGDTLSGCIVEIFGDTRIVEVGTWVVAQIKTSRELLLLDLRGDGAMKAGTVAAVCKDSNHAFSQQWSKFFYENHYQYKMLDGLIFWNAHNDDTGALPEM